MSFVRPVLWEIQPAAESESEDEGAVTTRGMKRGIATKALLTRDPNQLRPFEVIAVDNRPMPPLRDKVGDPKPYHGSLLTVSCRTLDYISANPGECSVTKSCKLSCRLTITVCWIKSRSSSSVVQEVQPPYHPYVDDLLQFKETRRRR